MKHLGKTILVILLASLSGLASAACDYPRKVQVPKGTEATKEEMVAGQKAIKQYMESMNTYLDCIETESKAAKSADEAAEVTAELESLLSKRHNAAIDEMEVVAADFNAQVRAYKAQSE